MNKVTNVPTRYFYKPIRFNITTIKRKSKWPQKKTVDYKLKLDPELHHWLKVHAAENYRTLSAEITMHLDQAMLKQKKETQGEQK